MEKIININMAGRVIAIEDRAYSRLTAYLESLRAYFAAEEGRDEIMADIESRIAELMADKIKRGTASIGEAEIEEILAGMGSVEDFAAADAEENTSSSSGAHPAFSTTKKHRRFFRDSNDKMLGGVCSGLASYLNVDPALVRIVFAILTIGGWGSGLLLYILLWMLVPAAPLGGYKEKRLFRNEDDKWIGGVCSGLGAYFGKDPMVFRGIFSLPILLSILSSAFNFLDGTSIIFGSFTGTLILIYIVLWVVLPPARSDFEKMEMRGEKVDLSSIRQNVQSGLGDLKSRAKDWSIEARSAATNFMNTRGRDFTREAAAAAHPIASRGGQAIRILMKFIALTLASVVAFAFFCVVIVWCFSGIAEFAADFVLRTPLQHWLCWAAVILLFGVPLLAIVTKIARRVLKILTRSNYLSFGFGLLWTAGWICVIALASTLGKDFDRYEKTSQELAILQPKSDKIILRVPGEEIIYSHSLNWLHGNIRGWDIDGDTMRTNRVEVLPTRSPDSQYHVILRRYSNGSDAVEALERARQISYPVGNTSDSVLALAPGYSISKAQKFRGQQVVLEVQVPVGRKIRFDKTVADKLNGERVIFRHHYYRTHWERASDNDNNTDWDSNTDYVMNADGDLTDPLEPPASQKILASTDTLGARTRAYKIDSLDRALNALQRQKDALEDSED